MSADTTDEGGVDFNGTEGRIGSAMHRYVFVSFIAFLENEGDGDGICCMKLGMVVRKFFAVLEEAKVVKSEYLCSTCFACRDVEILARPHCEKHRADY